MDKKARYDIVLPEGEQNFSIGSSINPILVLTKNGVPYKEEIEFIPLNKEYIRVVNGELIAKKEGTEEIIPTDEEIEKYTKNVIV